MWPLSKKSVPTGKGAGLRGTTLALPMLHPSLPSGCSRVSLPGLENLRRFMLFQVAAFLSGLVQIEQRVRKVAGGGRDVA